MTYETTYTKGKRNEYQLCVCNRKTKERRTILYENHAENEYIWLYGGKQKSNTKKDFYNTFKC